MTKKGIIYETLGKVSDLQIQESANSNEVRLSGVFGVCGIKNGNNRIYEKANYGKMVGILQEQILNEGVVGELEHPNTMNINLENISHKIEAIQMNEDGTVTGTIKLLDTPKGKIAKELINGGCPLYISSRGAGSIDESGHVTLSTIKTYDLVGTPGFSQAKLNLDKNQTLESLNESLENPCWMIVESVEGEEEDPKKDDEKDPVEDPKKEEGEKKQKDSDDKSKEDNKDNKDNKVTMEEIKKSIDALTEKVTNLEAQLHIAEEKVNNMKEVNYGAIQEWVEQEFAPVFESKIQSIVCEGVQKWVAEEFSPVVQEWVTEHYNKEVQNWVNESYNESIKNWIITEFAPIVEGWVAEEYSPIVEKYINEEFAPMVTNWVNEQVLPEHKRIITEEVNKNVSEFLESQKETKFDNIDRMLEKLTESAKSGKEAAQEILKESQTEKFKGCWAVENMPNQYRPMWEGLNESKQAEIVKHSRMYDFTKEGVLEKFWASQNLTNEVISESKIEVTTVNPLSSVASAMLKLRKQ